MKIESTNIVVTVVKFSHYEWKRRKLIIYHLLCKCIETSATPKEKKKLCCFSGNCDRLLVTTHPSLITIAAWSFVVTK